MILLPCEVDEISWKHYNINFRRNLLSGCQFYRKVISLRNDFVIIKYLLLETNVSNLFLWQVG